MASIDCNTFNPQYFTRHFTKRLTLACGLVAISTFNYAFDQQGFNSTQAMDAFNKAFGYYDPKEKTFVLETYYLSLLNSLVYIGFATGKVFDRYSSLLFAKMSRGIHWERDQFSLRPTHDYFHNVPVGDSYSNDPRHIRRESEQVAGECSIKFEWHRRAAILIFIIASCWPCP